MPFQSVLKALYGPREVIRAPTYAQACAALALQRRGLLTPAMMLRFECTKQMEDPLHEFFYAKPPGFLLHVRGGPEALAKMVRRAPSLAEVQRIQRGRHGREDIR